MMYQGASISQLAQIFASDNRTVKAKIYEVEPCGERDGYPIYQIRDVAPYLSEPLLDLDDIDKIAKYIRNMNQSNMPKMLSKEFWTAMLQRQKYEENAGDLWRTEKVIEVFAEFCKSVAYPIRLAVDNVQSETELTPRQRQVLTDICDGILRSIHGAVVSRFAATAQQEAEQADDDDDL